MGSSDIMEFPTWADIMDHISEIDSSKIPKLPELKVCFCFSSGLNEWVYTVEISMNQAGEHRQADRQTVWKWRVLCNRHSIRYQLLLTRHKSLKTRGHTKSQLVYEGWFILAVDLDFDACFVRRFVCVRNNDREQGVKEDRQLSDIHRNFKTTDKRSEEDCVTAGVSSRSWCVESRKNEQI